MKIASRNRYLSRLTKTLAIPWVIIVVVSLAVLSLPEVMFRITEWNKQRVAITFLRNAIGKDLDLGAIQQHVYCDMLRIGLTRHEIEASLVTINYEPREWNGREVVYWPAGFSARPLGVIHITFEHEHRLDARSIQVIVGLTDVEHRLEGLRFPLDDSVPYVPVCDASVHVR